MSLPPINLALSFPAVNTIFTPSNEHRVFEKGYQSGFQRGIHNRGDPLPYMGDHDYILPLIHHLGFVKGTMDLPSGSNEYSRSSDIPPNYNQRLKCMPITLC